jgi:hypothetical protein
MKNGEKNEYRNSIACLVDSRPGFVLRRNDRQEKQRGGALMLCPAGTA